MADINEIWNDTLQSIKNNINSSVSYNIHIKKSKPVSKNGSVFTISVENSISKNIIEYRYKNLIESILETVTGEKLSLNITDESKAENNQVKTQAVFGSEMSFYEVNPKFTFDNFIVGASNNIAYEAAKRSAEYPGQLDNPLFIYGNSGLGKTHLMHAIGNRIKEKFDNANIICVTCERFTNEYILAIREKTTDKFRAKYRSVDVLLIDDIQFLEGKEGAQNEFFHTFNELFSLGKQIVLTSDRKPGDLKNLTTRMRTRFGQGFTIDISLPDYETRIAILQNKAIAHDRNIDEEILGFIALNIKSSIRELESALLNVISKAEITGSEITLDFVKQTIDIDKSETVKITPKRIIEKVAFYYKITPNDILGDVKTKNIVVPRQISMYLCRRILGMNNSDISREMNKERTTIGSNINKIEELINNDEILLSDIEKIIKDIESK